MISTKQIFHTECHEITTHTLFQIYDTISYNFHHSYIIHIIQSHNIQEPFQHQKQYLTSKLSKSNISTSLKNIKTNNTIYK